MRGGLRLSRHGRALVYTLKALPEVLVPIAEGNRRVTDPTVGKLLGSCLTFRLTLTAASAGALLTLDVCLFHEAAASSAQSAVGYPPGGVGVNPVQRSHTN